MPVWRAIGRSCDGSAHRRVQLPNQDAIRLWEPRAGGPPVIVAVADGHGGARHFRSATGSSIAVEVAEGALHEVAERVAGGASAIKDVGDWLRHEIVTRWRARVDQDILSKPFTVAERSRLAGSDGENGAAAVDSDLEVDPSIAYGSTLLAGLLIDHTLLLLQLGDGDILAVDAMGKASRPIPRDARLVGNLTTSLCLPEAEDEMYIVVRSVHGGAEDPVMVLFSTDGYANSFVSPTDFERVGPDYLALAREHGVRWLADALPGFLTDASEHGSGDDVTVAILTCEGDKAAGAAKPAEAEWVEPQAVAPVPAVEARGREDSRMSLSGLLVIIVAVLVVAFFTWRVVGRPVDHRPPSTATPSPPPTAHPSTDSAGSSK